MLKILRWKILIGLIVHLSFIVTREIKLNINELYMERLLANMNLQLDPCEDFFGYACGNWAQHYNSTEYVDMPGYMDHKVNTQLLELIQANRDIKNGVYDKLLSYYETCMDVEQWVLNHYLKLVQTELNMTWPIFRADYNEPWTGESTFNWLKTIATLRWYGLNGIFITQNFNLRLHNGSHYILEIHQHENNYELTEKGLHAIFRNFGMTAEQSGNVTAKIVELERKMKKLVSGKSDENKEQTEVELNELREKSARDENMNNNENYVLQKQKLLKEQSNIIENSKYDLNSIDDRLAELREILKPDENETNEVNQKTEEELTDSLKKMQLLELQRAVEQETIHYEQSFTELTMAELREKVPHIDWQQYFSIILGRELNMTTEMVQTVSLNLNYMTQLREILASSTNETIAYYIMLKFMYKINEELPDAQIKSQKCLQHLRAYMPLATNYIYEQHLYKPLRSATDGALREIYAQLQQHFRHLIAENQLKLHDKERTFILEELDTMQLRIGNIPQTLDADFVAAYYAPLQLNTTNFYQNHLSLLRQHYVRQLQQLQNVAVPPKQHFYHHDPETASSSSPVKIFSNAILLPYGYLQQPLFESALAPLFQYSQLGFILAHEIVHAFDLFHIVYDRHGNYNPLGVYVAQHFAQSLQCLEQIGSAQENLSENIADVVGLRLAYRAYFDDLEMGSPQAVENTANMTQQQLFFVNSVQFLCANMAKISTMDAKHFNLEHDMHDVRVLQNWAQFEQFSRAFQCKEGTRMNPERKCRMW